MKPAALVFVAAVMIANASAQTPVALTSAEVVANIAGTWVDGPESDEPGICSEGEHRIWLVRDADDRLIFHEAWAGQFMTTSQSGKHKTGVARLLPLGADASGPGALAIRYDGEKRVMPDGDLVEWLLIMPDKESFYWKRRDWTGDDRTAASIRCPSPRKPPQAAGSDAAPNPAAAQHAH